MRTHYNKPDICVHVYGELYICNHVAYNRCTLFKNNGIGLAIIQQRYDSKTKSTYWTEIDDDIANDIYINKYFNEYFNSIASEKNTDGLYPTVTVRQIMYRLKMKPLRKEPWETMFDHSPI